ncbi:hypothetical protein BOSE62_70769 [Bosea sp. 62]|nr:hypothetical protein BOSE7B_50611 [Bosea sp. 7B]CAD5298741.1 hypothetical protein BOSE21B_90883 [Bosea sp. 21B]CAD5298901.1 hypothetical protein BOSE46_80957 [Bosea sp. 46]VVT61529.1 hypothetical protein BOS5A_230806 [Bosea sp. EC-HK365B]VXB11515.1 hypothetical protein BOSE127_100282 [Bosea sp. 127]VXC81186.1 hypothetical protein BOSE62_70769 [Bosea sp. 62]VXC85527.1 hypothetical protein BOSE29B_80842 [Bosea sp. 29B]
MVEAELGAIADKAFRTFVARLGLWNQPQAPYTSADE